MRRRPRILARWTLLPLIPFLLVQIFYGWPAAKLRFDDQPISLDGQPAGRIVALPAETGVKSVEVIITSHDGNFFLIIGAVTRGRSCHDQIDFICKSWRWLPKDSKP